MAYLIRFLIQDHALTNRYIIAYSKASTNL